MKGTLAGTLGAMALGAMLMMPVGGAMAAGNAAPGAATRAEAPMGAHHNRREHHPLIKRALRQLQHVKAELNRAPHDFKGHRAAAVGHVDQAINQLHQALKADVH